MTAPPIQITAVVVGSESVQAELVHLGADRRAKIGQAVKAAGFLIANRVKAAKLTGQVLRVRTGRLRSSINSNYSEQGDQFTSTIGTKLPYGRFWELGFHGIEHVDAFVRRNERFSSYAISGKHKQTAQGISFVKAHTRVVNQKARPFLKPSLNESRAAAKARINSAIAGN